MSFDDFARDRKTVYAVPRALEIISEASRRVPDDLKARHPGVDWQAVAAAGNVYRHVYEVIEDALDAGKRELLQRVQSRDGTAHRRAVEGRLGAASGSAGRAG